MRQRSLLPSKCFHLLSHFFCVWTLCSTRNVCATEEAQKKCEEAQIYEINMKEEASVWLDVGGRSV